MDPFTQTRKQEQPAMLGDALSKLMAPGPAGLSQRYETASKICQLWGQVLPPELAQHCRVVDFTQGLMTVEADSPSYMYEIRISSQQLVGFLRQAYPAAKIRSIKVMLTR